MIYNSFGGKFYIWVKGSKILSSFILFANPWFMPLMFVLAGICTRFSLEKRSAKEYLKERIKKLLIPFAAGLIMIVPFQTFFARKYFYNYNGNFIDNYKMFFSTLTDFSGYDGGFTPGHLWFILYLLIISVVSLLIKNIFIAKMKFIKIEKLNVIYIILFFMIILGMNYALNIGGGYSLGKYLSLFLLGHYLLSNDRIISKLEKNKITLFILYITSTVLLLYLYIRYNFISGILFDALFNFSGWMGVLSVLVIGKLYLNFSNKIAMYFVKSSYPVYILHQTILVAIAYYTVKFTGTVFFQVIIIMFGSFVLTILCYEIVKRIPFVNVLFGIK
jgi:surface polysaccharide O-acyltransferase-like enzyme